MTCLTAALLLGDSCKGDTRSTEILHRPGSSFSVCEPGHSCRPLLFSSTSGFYVLVSVLCGFVTIPCLFLTSRAAGSCIRAASTTTTLPDRFFVTFVVEMLQPTSLAITCLAQPDTSAMLPCLDSGLPLCQVSNSTGFGRGMKLLGTRDSESCLSVD